VAEWSRSAHARALADGNSAAPSCTGCHGSHTTACMGRGGNEGSERGACARCHAKELEQFERSPHKRPFARLGTDVCTGCHDHHDVPLATAGLMGVGPESTCVRCHAGADKPLTVASTLAELLDQVHEAVTRAQTALSTARVRGVPDSDLAPLAAELRASEHEMRVATHRVAVDPVSARVSDVSNVAARVENRSRALASRGVAGQRGIWAAVGLGTLVGIALLSFWTLRARRRQRGRS
jgi:hypothetical protein